MNVKKDVLAAITFLVTGFLFYVIHTDGKANSVYSTGLDCPTLERVLVGGSGPKAESPLLSHEKLTRDS